MELINLLPFAFRTHLPCEGAMKKFWLLILCCILPGMGWAESLENEFLRVVVNPGPDHKGRFAIETTKGDPTRSSDDDQPLIYGRPIPWTSYTTLLIDGIPFVFGGESTKKRGNTTYQYGKFISQELKDETIQTVYQFNQITVKQTLSFLKNPSSQVKDLVSIGYSVQNNDQVTHTIGLRIMLDTKLGANDGAPFRLGNQAVVSEEEFKGNAILEYFQVFDSLVSPNVIAQGYFKGVHEKTKLIDKVSLANWGSLFDSPWDYTFVKGRSFLREGEDEQDTALALYFDPQPMSPGQSELYQTAYGLGNVSVAKGALSLGLTAPSEVGINQKSTILIVGYVVNSGGYDAYNTQVTFTLPEGFEMKEGKKTISIGTLPAGATYQFPVKVAIKKAVPGKQEVTFAVTSSTLEANKITRKIEVIAPLPLGVDIKAPEKKEKGYYQYVPIEVLIQNPASIPIDDIVVEIKPGPGLLLSETEGTLKKEIKKLDSFKTVALPWILKLNTQKKVTEETLQVQVSSSIHPKTTQKKKIIFTEPPDQWVFAVSKPSIALKDYFFISLDASYYTEKEIPEITLSFDPDYLEFKRLSKEFPIKTADTQIKEKTIQIQSVPLEQIQTELPIAKWHFRAKKAGETKVVLTLRQDTLLLPVLIQDPSKTQNATD